MISPLVQLSHCPGGCALFSRQVVTLSLTTKLEKNPIPAPCPSLPSQNITSTPFNSKNLKKTRKCKRRGPMHSPPLSSLPELAESKAPNLYSVHRETCEIPYEKEIYGKVKSLHLRRKKDPKIFIHRTMVSLKISKKQFPKNFEILTKTQFKNLWKGKGKRKCDVKIEFIYHFVKTCPEKGKKERSGEGPFGEYSGKYWLPHKTKTNEKSLTPPRRVHCFSQKLGKS